MDSAKELAVVIPVYNEAENLSGLLADWQPIFRSTGVPYKVVLIDDGSKDDSLRIMRDLAVSDLTLDVHTQANTGHGPAILKGYQLGLDAEWIFQIDSDHQLATDTFRQLWASRADYDLLLGQRQDQNASQGRQWISRISKEFVRVIYGKGVKDVNVPYRLMRTQILRTVLSKIPADSFAPNVLLTSWFIRRKFKIFIAPVRQRKPGLRQSRLNSYFLKGVLRSSWQTILFRLR